MAAANKNKVVAYRLAMPSSYPSSSPNKDSERDSNHRRRRGVWLSPINCNCLALFFGGLGLVVLFLMSIGIPLAVVLTRSVTEISSTTITTGSTTTNTVTTTIATTTGATTTGSTTAGATTTGATTTTAATTTATTTTTPSFCAATCTGAFNSAGGTSCSKICYDSTSINTCSSSSTICPNANSAYYYYSVAPNGLTNIFGYNSYCNSAYASNYLANGFNPCYGGSHGYFNGTNYPGLIPNNSCCVYDNYYQDYYCIQYPCITSG